MNQVSMGSDLDLQRAVEALVDVDPSPEFLARVRQRVADEAPPARHAPWMAWAAAAGVVVLAAAASLAPELGPGEPVARVTPVLSSLALVPNALGAAMPVARSPRASAGAARLVSRGPQAEGAVAAEVAATPAPALAPFAPRAAAPIEWPEVVVSPSEVEAFRSLMTALDEEGEPRPSAATPRGNLTTPIPEITIEPIAAPLLELAALMEGETP